MLQDDGWTLVVTRGSHRQFKQAPGGAQRRQTVKRLRYLVRINKDPDSKTIGSSPPSSSGFSTRSGASAEPLRRIQRDPRLAPRRAEGSALESHADRA